MVLLESWLDAAITAGPILHAGTIITTTAVPGGVRFHLGATSPFRIKELQNIVSARAARLPGLASS